MNAVMNHRPIYQIAADVSKDWGAKVNYAAKPYLSAMADLDSIKGRYFEDSAESIVAYFLANAGSWRGEKAKAIKVELNKMLKDAR